MGGELGAVALDYGFHLYTKGNLAKEEDPVECQADQGQDDVNDSKETGHGVLVISGQCPGIVEGSTLHLASAEAKRM